MRIHRRLLSQVLAVGAIALGSMAAPAESHASELEVPPRRVSITCGGVRTGQSLVRGRKVPVLHLLRRGLDQLEAALGGAA